MRESPGQAHTDRYARIPMPWAHRGLHFLSPSYHRIDPDMPLRTRCGMPVPKSTYDHAHDFGNLSNMAHPLKPKVCRTCDGMAKPNAKRPEHLKAAR